MMDLDKHTVNMGSHESLIVCKMYGPTIFCNLRIAPDAEACKWRIEREVIKQDSEDNDYSYYEPVCEIDGQESISFRYR